MPSRSSSTARPLLQRPHDLLGPRPAPLKVSTGTTTTGGTDLQVVNRRRRRPVIIYVESPRVVHAHPAEFKSVVQRLTGAAPAASALPLPLQFQFPSVGAAGRAVLPLTSSVMSVVTVADTSGGGSSPVQQLANHHLLVSSDPFDLPPPPSLAACYHQHHGCDLLINHHQ